MRKTYCLVSVVLVLSLASTSFGLVIGDFEGGLDGWSAKDAALTLGATGATLGAGALQVDGPGDWHIDALLDMKPIRTELGVKGVTITADVTAFAADMTTTWMQVEMVVNGQNNNDNGANNNVGWQGLGLQDVVRDGLPRKHTWVLPEALTTAIAGTDPNIAWFELALVSNLDAASVTKFYIDNIQIVPPAKKIVWVSFHGADDAPSADAVANGFTQAPDKGYTDLLTANGYDVARYVTTKTPDVNMLNAADLVIISRSVDSSHYGSDAATIWNTKITAPMIVTGGYTLRKNRMGYTAGGTIPDTTGDIRLTVSDPNHPIFAGVALTNGTMDNPFAGLAIYPTDGTVARGVSVNTDAPNAAGTVLATIAGPADPNDPNDPNDTFDPITGPVGGMIIAEWSARVTTLTHDAGAGTDVLAGRRLVFLTGSREANGKKSATAGMFDLYDDGAKMFLNAVAYMLTAKPVVIPVVNASFEQPGTEKIKGWNGEGVGGTPAVNIPGWASDTAVADSGVETGWTATDGQWTAFLMGADPSVWQSTGFVIQASDVLTLSVDARNTWQGTTLRMTLYFEDAGVRVPAATADVAVTDTMQQFTLTLDAAQVPAAAGKVLGIEFDNVTTNGQSWIGLDNVSLTLE
jgi:hypothetical protein